MASSAQIAHDLRMQANALEGRHLQGTMLTGLCRSLRRGADEIERLEAELTWLRGFADQVLAAEAAELEDAA
ncbi:hypothetical protein [Paracoccus sanguinis]|uniref:Uncharacterized protein n=1 Tax=Paracoccus sanguinis TaxID=1545044 RepID=A0A1H3BNQ0_9RHOB|nr:hypothetical protein [Paracoccus sanguinis]KGJ18712.1 hypothetical protein IX57_03030 [Paracoccus sanguinis]SDX43566.1 hypothetical protein SAMN05444276_106102 [Paracoccus sanguinis]